MKSIMEESSSIAKAIEKGWERAGKPQEFTVKVFEEAQKNFLGMTTKSAKIALFFEERSIPAQKNLREQAHKKQTPHPKAQTQPQHQKQQQVQAQQDRQPKKIQPTTSPWNDDLVQSAQEWINESLAILGVRKISFTTEVDRFAIKFNFNGLITDSNEKEKMLFRSWAYLIMQALRQKYRRPLKGLKIILMSNA